MFSGYKVIVCPKTGARQIVSEIGHNLIATMASGTSEEHAHLLAASPHMLYALKMDPDRYEYSIARAEGKELLVRMLEGG